MMLIITINVSAQDSVESLLNRIDRIYRQDSSISLMEMKIVTPYWERVLKMSIWTKGKRNTLVRIILPKKDAGVATLRKGEEMWNFFPKINKVIKVPASMRMGSWMGSDLTNDDLVKETTLVNDYNSKFLKSDDNGFYVIESKPTAKTISMWGKIITVISKENIMPVRQQYFNERSEIARTWNFKAVKVLGGRLMPTIIELISETKKGNKTVVKYLDVDFSASVDAKVFTRKNLQKRM